MLVRPRQTEKPVKKNEDNLISLAMIVGVGNASQERLSLVDRKDRRFAMESVNQVNLTVFALVK
jgi:hypothetical protein